MNFNINDARLALKELGMAADNADPETVRAWLITAGFSWEGEQIDRTRPGNFSTIQDCLEAVRLVNEISAVYRVDPSRHFGHVAPAGEPAAVQGHYQDTAHYTQSLDRMFHNITTPTTPQES